MSLTIAVDNSADELELCDKTFEFMFPAEGSDDPMFVRYRCDRCDHVGAEAFGPQHQMSEIRDAAEMLFDGSVSCAAQG